LVDEKGLLKHGFVGLMLLSFLKKKEFQEQAEVEIKAQIEKALSLGLKITHLDSHRHVHMIPFLFDVFEKVQKEYNIPRLRVVNESFLHTFFSINNFGCFFDGGIIKYALLKAFYYLNRNKSDTYFYSIIYTTKLFGQNVGKIVVPKKFKAVEISIHPSIVEEDKKIGSDAFADYLLYSPDRQREFETVMDKGLPDRITFS
jgi:predicted glycoside hydrolase/deacetylase ChbG (UPF0249 family)